MVNAYRRQHAITSSVMLELLTMQASERRLSLEYLSERMLLLLLVYY